MNITNYLYFKCKAFVIIPFFQKLNKILLFLLKNELELRILRSLIGPVVRTSLIIKKFLSEKTGVQFLYGATFCLNKLFYSF